LRAVALVLIFARKNQDFGDFMDFTIFHDFLENFMIRNRVWPKKHDQDFGQKKISFQTTIKKNPRC